jgi:hypothetical protein
MRSVLRALLTSAFIAALAFAATTGAAFAAAEHSNGNGTSFELYEDLCINDELDSSVWYCFQVHGRFTAVAQDNGDQIGTGAVRNRFSVIDDGVVVSASLDHSVFQSKIVDGWFQDELIISQTRTLTPGQQCVAHLLLKYEDGVIVVDQSSMSCN